MDKATAPAGRAPPSGSAEAARQAIQQAAQGWPGLPESFGDGPAAAALWRAVMQARLPIQWHPIDLQHAANLVRCLRDIDEHDAALQREGFLIGKGADKRANPRHAIVDTLNRRAVMLTRLLQLHAVPTARVADKTGSKAEAGAAAAMIDQVAPAPGATGFNAMSLIARPRLQ